MFDLVSDWQAFLNKEFDYLNSLEKIESFSVEKDNFEYKSKKIINGELISQGYKFSIIPLDEAFRKTKLIVDDILKQHKNVFLRQFPELIITNDGIGYIRLRIAYEDGDKIC